MVLRGSQIVDISLTPGETKAGRITPIVSVEGGRLIDYDRMDRIIYWLQGNSKWKYSLFYYILKFRILFKRFKQC